MFVQDLRIAVRHLRKSPGFSVTAVLMLALGIGATTAIFSIVEGVLLRPLPFPQSERLVSLSDILQGANLGDNSEAGVTAPDILAYTRDTHSFDSLGGYEQASYELSGIGEPAQVNGARMSGGVLPALGAAPLMGRVFTTREDEQSEPVTVISYVLWQNRLHADPHVLGSKILLDRKPYVIVGVMPRQFEFPLVPGHLNNSELWIPMSFTQQETGVTGQANWNYNMVGRLKAGVTIEQAQQDTERVAQETMRIIRHSWRASTYRQWSFAAGGDSFGTGAPPGAHAVLCSGGCVADRVCEPGGALLVRAIRRRRDCECGSPLVERAHTHSSSVIVRGAWS